MEDDIVIVSEQSTIVVQSEGTQGPPGPPGPEYTLPETVLNTSSYIDGGTFN